MASTHALKFKGRTVEWEIVDAITIEAATANILWHSSVGGTSDPGDTESYWQVKRITFVPSTAETTGGFARLYDGGDGTTGATELVRFNMMINESDIQTYDFNEGYRCQPVYPSTLQKELTAGCKFIFHLA